MPDEVFFARVVAATETPGWVLDGNYNRSRPVKWRNVDLVVWVDYGFARTLRQAICRAISRQAAVRSCGREPATVKASGRAFLSRDSIIWWTLKTWKNNRQRYQSDMTDPAYRHILLCTPASPAADRGFHPSAAAAGGAALSAYIYFPAEYM